MKRTYFLFFAITIVFLVPQSWSAEWVSVGTAVGDNNFFYDQESLTRLPNGIIKVWEKIEYSEKQRKEHIKWRISKKYDVDRYNTLNRTLNLIEINCETRELRTLMTADYSSTHGPLESNTYKWQPTEGWTAIIPDSIVENIYKAICPPREKK
jgi:hypothetical protein